MNSYKALKQQIFTYENYSLVPIRMKDRFDIMKWRNEQIYHLRQNVVLTVEMQDNYFDNVVAKLFDLERPAQVLFSYLHNNTCIGYGGLVHINWIDKNAELSFIMSTELEKTEFNKHWSIYIKLIKEVAFVDLGLHKVYTYAFDLRPHLYKVLEDNGFVREAILNEHCLCNNKYKDVVIHSIIDGTDRIRQK